MLGLGFVIRGEASLETLTAEVIKSSVIAGEILGYAQVHSSLARKLSIDIGGLEPNHRHVESIVEMMLDAIHNYHLPLTAERLFNWHAALFPTTGFVVEPPKVAGFRSFLAASARELFL